MSAARRENAVGIIIGAGSVALITWARVAVALVVGSDMALILYVLAVLAAAGVGGEVAGLVTTVLSLAAGVLFIITPHAFASSPAEWVRVIVFTVEGVAISLTVEQLQRRTKQLRKTVAELDSERQLVERMALEDMMTGLANRRAFQRDIEKSVARFERNGAPLTVVIADIDGLKRTNDVLGHEQGDALLIAVALGLREGCRASDEAYRIGGDEFALLLPGTGRNDYDAVAIRLDDRLRDACAPFPGTGVTLGAAHAPEEVGDPDGLVRLADSRMYKEKAASHRTLSRPTNGST